MIANIINRLKAEARALKLVGGAADFASASETSPRAHPAAYVLPLHERTRGDEEIGCGITQVVEATFGVAIAIVNVSDAKGGAAAADLDAIRQAVREALLGWAPDGSEDGFEYAGGALLGFVGNALWWQDAYSILYLMDAPS